MPQFENPFEEKRQDSPGEQAQKIAETISDLAFLFRVDLTPNETQGLAKVVGGILRAFPHLRSDK